MHRSLPIVPALLLAVSAGLAQNPPAPAPDTAAGRAVEDLSARLARGEAVSWLSSSDAAIDFVGKYTGLGSDVVTVLGLGEPEAVWPAWKKAGEGLENFGIAVSFYTVLAEASKGRGDRAILGALRDFAKYRLSKLPAGGALYAGGIGILDFALTSLGETAMSLNNEKFYTAYRAYHAMRRPAKREYVEIIRQGGFDALAKELDTYWDIDPGSADIDWDPRNMGGYETLRKQDDQHKEHFRARFIREEILVFLTMWAEREADKARDRAREAAEQLVREILETSLVVEVPVIEAGLGEPPAGWTAEFLDGSGKAVLASGPVGPDGARAEIPLRAIAPDGRFAGSLTLMLKYGADPKASPVRLSLNLHEAPPVWTRAAKGMRVTFRRRKPAVVETKFRVTVAVGGPDAAKVGSVKLLPVTLRADRALDPFSAPRGRPIEIAVRGGSGSADVPAGRYLLQSVNGPVQGPVEVRAPATIPYTASPVTSGDAKDPAAPDPSALASALSSMTEKIRGRTGSREAAEAEVRKSYEAFWSAATGALNDFWRSAEACRLKGEEEIRPVDEELQRLQSARGNAGSEDAGRAIDEQIRQAQAKRDGIRKTYADKATELQHRRETAERDLDGAAAAARKQMEEADRAQREEIRRRQDALRQAEDGLRDLVNRIENGQREAANAFDQVAEPVRLGYWAMMAEPQAEETAGRIRAALPRVEQAAAQALADRQALDAAVARYREARTALAEACAFTGDECRENAGLLEQAAAAAGRADALRDADLPAQAKSFVERFDRSREHRREARRLAAGRVLAVETAAAALPAVDSAAWGNAVADFRTRASALIGGIAEAGADDDGPEWKRLSDDIETWSAGRRDLVADLLEGAGHGETPFSRFNDAFAAMMDAVVLPDVPPEWWAKMQQGPFARMIERENAARPFLAVRTDARKALALGGTRSGRAAAVKEAREKIGKILDAPAAGADGGRRLEAVRDAGREIDRIGRGAAGDLFARWDRARADLARSDAVEAWARQQGTPFLRFKTLDGQPYEKGFFWPETVPPGDANHPMIDLGIAVDGIADPEETQFLIRISYDRGRSWMPVSRNSDGTFHLFLPRDRAQWAADSFRIQADLPGKRHLPDWEGLPWIRYPE